MAKVRYGFVSNSSSSSFVVVAKTDNLSRKFVLKELQITEDHPLYIFADQLAEFISRRTDIDGHSVEHFVEQNGFDDVQDFISYVGKDTFTAITDDTALFGNLTVHSDDYDESISAMLYTNDRFEIDTPNLKVKSLWG